MKKTVPITICIPCYKYHIPQLKRCLDAIEEQSVLPNAVIVSCSSSVDADIEKYISAYEDFSFPLKIITTPNRKNAAENRNIAATAANTEFLSFFDADDVMHPQRLEALSAAIQEYPGTEIILHNYYTTEESKRLSSWPTHMIFSLHQNSLAKAPSGCAIFITNWQERIHHSQVSVSKSLWERVRFNEAVDNERKEDAVFCGSCLAQPTIQSVYISQPLSKYFEEGATRTV